jgi:hypothetical protein
MSDTLTRYPLSMHPRIGAGVELSPGVALVKYSTRKRTVAPGSAIARVIAADTLGLTRTGNLSAHVVAQKAGAWILCLVTLDDEVN